MGKIRLFFRNFRNRQIEFSSTEPISRSFGFDRGLPIDRYYIEKFLSENKGYIKGTVLEVGSDTYTKKFGSRVHRSDVLTPSHASDRGTLVGDLSTPETLPSSRYDCFICTQTINFIYDFQTAIRSLHKVLKQGGMVLATLAGLAQISRYDMDRWGDFWRFTNLSAHRMFSEVFGEDHVEVMTHGNVLAAIAFLEGLASEELTKDILDHHDKDYQIVISVKARKSENI